MVPKLGHVHESQHGCEHDDVEESVEPVPVLEEEDERWQSDARCDASIRIQVPDGRLGGARPGLDIDNVFQA